MFIGPEWRRVVRKLTTGLCFMLKLGLGMFTNCKTNLIVNNLSEILNKMILDVKNKPIRTTIEE
jgi:hypothetical protein